MISSLFPQRPQFKAVVKGKFIVLLVILDLLDTVLSINQKQKEHITVIFNITTIIIISPFCPWLVT